MALADIPDDDFAECVAWTLERVAEGFEREGSALIWTAGEVAESLRSHAAGARVLFQEQDS